MRAESSESPPLEKQNGADGTGSMMRSEDLTRALRGILVTAAVGSGVGLLFGLIYDDGPATVVGGVSLPVLPLIWWLVRRGHVTAASLSLLLLFDVLSVYALCFGGGVQDPTALLFPVMIIASGVLLDRRVALGTSAVIVLSYIGVGVGELTGLVETRLSPLLVTSDVVFLSMLIVVVASMVHFMSQALRDSIQRASITHESYRQIFNAASEGIVVHDAETSEIVDANESALEMFGYSEATRDGFTMDNVLLSDPRFDKAAAMERIANAAHRSEPFEWCVRHLDGTTAWIEVVLTPAVIQGHPRVISVFRDTSERRVLQEQVRQAEKLNAVGQLARGVAHDFNNQLTVILANASLLEAGVAGDATLTEYARAIIESSRRSADLTHQLLAFARKGQRRHEPIDVDALVADVRGLLARSIDKRIEVVHERAGGAAVIEGDATFLQNALLNLGLNARDAMPEGGTLRLVVEPPKPGGADGGARGDRPTVTIRVEDTGCGMDEDVLEHVFEPFYTTKDEGNGMGLAAVYGTVAAHDGSIVIDSAPGRGTTVTIAIPAASADAPPARIASEAAIARRHEGVRVLLAEDEPGVARVATSILGRLGCLVTHVADGASALDALRNAEPGFDVALLDHSMPGMTGSEVLEKLRAEGRTIPVIATSGYTEAGEAPSAARPDHFLPKPFNLASLSRALDELLGRPG